MAHTGELSYVEFLVPGFVVTGVLFQGMGAASGIADDLEGGFIDRLRSLPIRLLSVVTGRVGADTVLVAWGVVVMTVIGFLVGFRLNASVARRRGRPRADHPLRLRIRVGLHHPGAHGGKPASGPELVVPGLPADLRLERLRPRSDDARLDAGIRQPPTHDAHVRHRPDSDWGAAAEDLLGHSLSYYLVPSLLWTAGIIAVFAPLAAWKLKRS